MTVSDTRHTWDTSSRAFAERSARFIPLFSSRLVFRNYLGDGNGESSSERGQTDESRIDRASEFPLRLNDSMFFIRPTNERSDGDSREGNAEAAQEDISDSNKDNLQVENANHHEAIAGALGFGGNPRVYQLTSTGSFRGNDSNISQNMGTPNLSSESFDITGPLAAMSSSKVARQFLASRPSSSPTLPKRVPLLLSKPDHNLEAPGLKDDFYCNVVSWSQMTNRIAVGLSNAVYSWSTDNEVILIHHDANVSVTAVLHSPGDFLLIGKANGDILLVSQTENEVKASFSNRGKTIFCFEWFPDCRRFFAGDSKGDVLYFDILRDMSGVFHLKLKCILESHRQQICGITLNSDLTQVAVGGNDNCCSIWDITDVLNPSIKLVLPHKAAVKAIAFCPWANAILATGGGSNDRTIRFWHANTGTLLSSFPAGAQVTSLFWCKDRKEVIATFGYGNAEKPLLVAAYSYPQMVPLIEVSSSAYLRCLSACQSPDGNSLCVAASDAFIRIYKVWHSSYGLKLSPVSKSVGLYGSSLIEMYEGITKNGIIR